MESCLPRLVAKPDPMNRRWQLWREKQAESQEKQWQKWALRACQEGPETKDYVQQFYSNLHSVQKVIPFIILSLDLIFLTPYKWRQHFTFPIEKHQLKVASHTVALQWKQEEYSSSFFQSFLIMHCKNKQWKPLSFFSQGHSPC